MKIDDCTDCGEERPIQARGLCEKCYSRQRRDRAGRPACGTIEAWRQHRRRHTPVCAACEAARTTYLAEKNPDRSTTRSRSQTRVPSVLPAPDVERLRHLVDQEAAERAARLRRTRTPRPHGSRPLGSENPLRRTA